MPEKEELPRCRALAMAGKPGQLIVRCKLPEGHPRDHDPDMDEYLGD